MSDHPSLSPKCPHGVMLEYARCMQCEDPAFHAAQQPPANVRTASIGGQTPVLTKDESLKRLRNAVAAMAAWPDHAAILRSGVDWVASESGARRSITVGDLRLLLEAVDAREAPPSYVLFRAAGWLAAPDGESRESTVSLIKDLVARIDPTNPETGGKHHCATCQCPEIEAMGSMDPKEWVKRE